MKAMVPALWIVSGLAVAPAFAHHSISAVYDRSMPKEFKGTVTKVEWLNPHARVYVDVRQTDGRVLNWEFELGSPNGLMQHGWTRYTLKKGDVVAVSAEPARDGSNRASARFVVGPGGQKLPNYDRFEALASGKQ